MNLAENFTRTNSLDMIWIFTWWFCADQRYKTISFKPNALVGKRLFFHADGSEMIESQLSSTLTDQMDFGTCREAKTKLMYRKGDQSGLLTIDGYSKTSKFFFESLCYKKHKSLNMTQQYLAFYESQLDTFSTRNL